MENKDQKMSFIRFDKNITSKDKGMWIEMAKKENMKLELWIVKTLNNAVDQEIKQKAV